MGEVSRTELSDSTRSEDHAMRIIIALAAITACLALGGCFHHSQQIYSAELPPEPISTPIK
jgi:hypothetical protein